MTDLYYDESYPPSLWEGDGGGGADEIVLTSIAPNTGAAAATPLTITYTGTGFTADCVVMIGGAQRAVDSWNPTTIVCTVPNTTGWSGPMPTTVYDTATTVESNPVIFNATVLAEEPTGEPTETPTEPSGGGAGYAPRATKSRKRTT